MVNELRNFAFTPREMYFLPVNSGGTWKWPWPAGSGMRIVLLRRGVTFQIRCFYVSVSSFLPKWEPWKQTVDEVGERPCQWYSRFENCGTQQILRHEEGAEVLGRTNELGRRDGYTACTHGRNGRPASHPTTPKSAFWGPPTEFLWRKSSLLPTWSPSLGVQPGSQGYELIPLWHLRTLWCHPTFLSPHSLPFPPACSIPSGKHFSNKNSNDCKNSLMGTVLQMFKSKKWVSAYVECSVSVLSSENV